MVTMTHNGHRIDVEGYRKVYYDGKLVSNNFRVGGANHTFKVKENKKTVQYDVEMGSR